MNIRASIKIDERQLQKEIQLELQRKVNKAIPKIQTELNNRLPALLKKHFDACSYIHITAYVLKYLLF